MLVQIICCLLHLIERLFIKKSVAENSENHRRSWELNNEGGKETNIQTDRLCKTCNLIARTYRYSSCKVGALE